MKDSNSLMTRRDVLAASLATATLSATGSALAQPAEMPSTSRELWQWTRTQPVLDLQLAYLDVASAGPTLRACMAAEYRARESQSLGVAGAANERWSAETTRLATRCATFAGCDPDEVLFTRGTGEGIGMVAAGLDLNAGDEIVTTDREHPAALSPWLVLARRRGVVVKQVSLPAPLTGPDQAVGLISDALTERTKVIVFQHVQYSDGAILPVRELCALARQRNIVSVVVGAQAFGMLDFALRDLGCDFYAASFHKWLGGCHGTGMLYVRREMLDRLWPVEPRGIDASPPVLTPTQSAGHEGVPAALHKLGNILPHVWPALRGAEAALEFQQQVLRSRIDARVKELAIYARIRLQPFSGLELLTPAQPGTWAGILTFRAKGRPAPEVAASLVRSHRVYVRDLQWPGMAEGALRASFQIFNSHDDVDRLAQGLQQALR
jgi:selenocysteine lyase/cysteine desulfurase